MAKVALIESKPSRIDFERHFNNAFEFDKYSLTSNPDLQKVLKRDVDIEVDLEEYDWVILVGSEPLKYYTKQTAITTYTGRIIDDKFLPIINPSMIKFKPEAKKPWEESRDNVIGYITGTKTVASFDDKEFIGIDTEKEALEYITKAIEYPREYIALDSETTALYPRDGYILGLSLTYKPDSGAYILTDVLNEECEEKLQYLFNKKKVIFHNSKFDIPFFKYHFNFEFPEYEDTMLMHYVLDETQGSHGLKELALKFTKYGDYEKEQGDWVASYCREHKILKSDFTFDLIPFDIIKKYAAIDSCVTYALYEKFKPYLDKNSKLQKVYSSILIPSNNMLIDIQDNGVPFDLNRLLFGQKEMQKQISEAEDKLREFKEIAELEIEQGKPFNPNSTMQLRKLLFDHIGLKPTGKLTGTGAHSTDAEVLEQLAEVHPIPSAILNIRKSSKIKNTYLDKIIPQLDRDCRLRTNFNLHTTTSGRLSSSGKLNMQQLPRDNPTVKGCIRAKEGHQIVAMDLLTAEMWVAAAVSNDLELQDVFRSGGNFHSTIAKKVFNLSDPVEDIAVKHASLRQASKAVSFGILYGASANKIAETVTKEGASMSKRQAQEVINDYFNTFWKLKEWIDETQEFIKTNAYIYSPLGRKRRLPNVRSDNRGVQGHEIRSGLNFIIQSVSSDINLLGCVDMNEYIKKNNMRSKIFALVHDSVLAEVPVEEVEEYKNKLEEFIQKDRGIYIPGCPVGCDFDVHEDYSLGKFTKLYGDNL